MGALVSSLKGRAGVEVIVADGGSVDGTAGEASAAGAVVVRSGRGRAVQMNAGAKAAAGRIILFLHADTRLPANFEHLVTLAIAEHGAVGGSFRFSLDEDTPFFRLITYTANLRSRRMGVVFGDQAIFALADEFRRLGGYPDQPLMEDCELVRRLRTRGRFVILPEAAVTSARKWREIGPVRTTLMNVVITWAWVIGFSPRRLRSWRDRLSGEAARPRPLWRRLR